jgi:GTPase SAR1 family protein
MIYILIIGDVCSGKTTLANKILAKNKGMLYDDVSNIRQMRKTVGDNFDRHRDNSNMIIMTTQFENQKEWDQFDQVIKMGRNHEYEIVKMNKNAFENHMVQTN